MSNEKTLELTRMAENVINSPDMHFPWASAFADSDAGLVQNTRTLVMIDLPSPIAAAIEGGAEVDPELTSWILRVLLEEGIATTLLRKYKTALTIKSSHRKWLEEATSCPL